MHDAGDVNRAECSISAQLTKKCTKNTKIKPENKRQHEVDLRSRVTGLCVGSTLNEWLAAACRAFVRSDS